MLKKDPVKRPTVEDIIFCADFQQMALKLKVNLPLVLNREKLQ